MCVKLLQRSSDTNASQVPDTGLNSNSYVGKTYSYKHRRPVVVITLSMSDKVAEFSRIYSYICTLWDSTERMH